MSLRIDSSEWISGALIIGDVGLGVLGSEIATDGDNGPGYAYNDLTLPDDASKEICGRITTWPTLGTLTAYEDTSFEFVGPDGVHSFAYQLYVDGVAVGSPTTVNLLVGTASATASGSIHQVSMVPPAGGALGTSLENATAVGYFKQIVLSAPTGWAEGTGINDHAKVGGDDVPRYEVWEKKRKFKREDALEATIEATYRKLAGHEPEPEVVDEVIAEAKAVENQDLATITQLIQQQIDEEEDEILLLLAA